MRRLSVTLVSLGATWLTILWLDHGRTTEKPLNWLIELGACVAVVWSLARSRKSGWGPFRRRFRAGERGTGSRVRRVRSREDELGVKLRQVIERHAGAPDAFPAMNNDETHEPGEVQTASPPPPAQRLEPPQVQVGQILAEKYRVDRILSIGDACVVVAAHHILRDEKVALKLWARGVIGHDAMAVERFLREARWAKPFKGEHIARVTEVSTLVDGTPYIEMEALDGVDLAAWLEERGPLPIVQAVEFVLHACSALGEPHAVGIVHGDLSPANLFCVRGADGRFSIKVLDLPMVRQVRIAAAIATATAKAAFIPLLYMSPEELQGGENVDGRTDIWALGILLFELLTRMPPFFGESLGELFSHFASDPPRSLRGIRPDIPPALEAVLLRCLEKEPEQRYSSVEELAEAIQPFAPEPSRAVTGVT